MNLTPSIGWYRKVFWCGDSSCWLCWFIDKAYWLLGVQILLVALEIVRERI